VDTINYVRGTSSSNFTIGSDFTTGIIGTSEVTPAIDITDRDHVKFYFRSSTPLTAGDLQFIMSDSQKCAVQTETLNLPPISTSDTWVRCTLSLTNQHELTELRSIGLSLQTDSGAMVVNIDDVRAYATNYDIKESEVTTALERGRVNACDRLNLTTPAQLPTDSVIVDHAIADISAGLLWKYRYTAKTPDVDLLPYGDELINMGYKGLDSYQENVKEEGGIQYTRDRTLGEWDETKEYYSYTEKGIQDSDEDEYEDSAEDDRYDEVRPQ
jgi:hypothetical protein